jgi:flagellar basal body rod protein FlgC
MQRLILLLLLCSSFCYAQERIDFSGISKEKIVFEETLGITDKALAKNILLLGIDISLDHIANEETTITADEGPYKYHYIFVRSDLSFTVMEKDKFQIEYDPTHPDAIKIDSDLIGYVNYSDIDIQQEYDDIIEMVKILKALEMRTE